MNRTRQIYSLLLFLLLLPLGNLNAQKQQIDSLTEELKKHVTADTTRVKLLNRLAWAIRLTDLKAAKRYADESGKIADQLGYLRGKAISLQTLGIIFNGKDNKLSLDYYQKGLDIARRIGNKKQISHFLLYIGILSSSLGDVEKCDKCYKEALSLARETGNKKQIASILFNMSQRLTSDADYQGATKLLQEIISIAENVDRERLTATVYGQLGFIHIRQGNYPVALDYYLSALKNSEKAGFALGISNSLLNISDIQISLKNYDEALKTLQKLFLRAKKLGNVRSMTDALMSIGSFYMENDPKMAMRYYQKALVMNKDNNIRFRITILTAIGSLYINEVKIDEALKCFEEALELALKIDLKRAIGELQGKLGQIYWIKKQHQQALNYTQQALQIAKEKNLLKLQEESYAQLSMIYAATSAFEKAYQSHVQFKIVNDSLFNEKIIREAAILESNYKYNKEKQIYEIEKSAQEVKIQSQKQVILSLIIVSVLVLSLAVAIYWTNKLKKKVLNLEIENKNHEIEINQKAMTAATLKLMENSERDTYSVKMLENIKKNTIDEGQSDIRTLISEYKLKSYNSNWSEFEILFQKINSSFYEKLNERYPNLTPNERKLCVFLKLNMNNSHISQVTFQSEEALKKARLRLRKKLEIDRDTNLLAFIQSI